MIFLSKLVFYNRKSKPNSFLLKHDHYKTEYLVQVSVEFL